MMEIKTILVASLWIMHTKSCGLIFYTVFILFLPCLGGSIGCWNRLRYWENVLIIFIRSIYPLYRSRETHIM